MDAVFAHQHKRETANATKITGAPAKSKNSAAKCSILPRCKIKSQLFWIPWLSPIIRAERFMIKEYSSAGFRSKSIAGLRTSPEVISADESCSSECLKCFNFSFDVQMCFRDAAVDSFHGLKGAARLHKEKHLPIPKIPKSYQCTGSETCCE
jgi:hypothetical protein